MNERAYYKSPPIPLSQKSRAKSAPNLDIQRNSEVDVPRWVADNRTGVNYAVGQLLGKGGFAKCFLTCSNRQYFALKVISRQSIKKQIHLAKIRKEIYTHFSLRHPNIVALYNTFEDCENIYMLLEYCSNRTLAELIDTSPGRFLPEQSAVIFFRQLLFAVRYLHYDCGLLHRDIKPGNILLSHEMTVKLADFGFCCSIRELKMHKEQHTVCGTPNYVPVEVIDKCGHSVHSEYWAVACTFYSMLYGRPPFHSGNLDATYSRIRRCDYTFPERCPPISENAKDLIQRTLIRESSQRLNIDEMLAHPALNQSILKRSPSSGNQFNDAALPLQPFSDMSTLFSRSISHAAPTLFTTIPPNVTMRSKNTKSQLCLNDQNQNQTALVDSGLGSSELSNGLGKLMQHTLEKYILALSMVMDSFNPLCLKPMAESLLPPSFVGKWVDYTNKFGFGITLCDGTRSILFNDQSSLSSTHCQRYISYHVHKFNDLCIEWEHQEGFPSSELCEKFTMMYSLRNYMDRELYSSVPIKPELYSNNPYFYYSHRLRSQSGTRNNSIRHQYHPNIDFLRRTKSSSSIATEKQKKSHQQSSTQGDYQRPLVHIIDFHKFTDELFVFLSDGTCQVNFTGSHDKLIICSASPQGSSSVESFQLHLVTGDQQVYSFQTVHNFDYDTLAPPLSDMGWARLGAFQRVLQSYQHFLLTRCNGFFSTYC